MPDPLSWPARGLRKEDAENFHTQRKEEQASTGPHNLAVINFQNFTYHTAEILRISAFYPQPMPVVVQANNLTSPKSDSSSSSVNQGGHQHVLATFVANSHSKSYIPATFENRYYQNLAVPIDELNSETSLLQHDWLDPFVEGTQCAKDCQAKFHWEVFSPQEAIQESYFEPVHNPDPRFKLRQLSSGGQAWVFTSSRSQTYWLEQCREGIAQANSCLAGRSSDFVPLDPFCPLVERIIFDTSFLADSIVNGAKRWYTIVSTDAELKVEAIACSVLKFSSTSFQPLSFASSTANLALLFLACVRVEASRSGNTCFDWETKEEFHDWVLKSNLKGSDLEERKHLVACKWALAKACKFESLRV